jgi:ribosomal-protein-alanine N-acetyltransferase
MKLARPADAAAIAALSRDLIEYGLRWRWRPRRVAASIRAPEVNVLVARIHDNLAGFAIMRYGDDGHGRLPWRRRIERGVGANFEAGKCAVVAVYLTSHRSARERRSSSILSCMGYLALVELPGYYQGVEAALRMGPDLSSRTRDQSIL